MIKHNLSTPISNTFLQTLKVIKDNGKGMVFVTDSDDILMGVLTDGDIRSALLKGVELDSPIEPHINRTFVFAYHSEPFSEILKKADDRIKIIPLVDETMKLIDYVEFSNKVYFPVATPELSGNELKYLTDAFLSTWISSQGKYIEEFEKKFSAYCDAKYGVAVSNGTTALHLALLALGIGEGDEVIVPDLTFAATINTVLHANATPVIVDIEKISWCIDPIEIEKAITPRTKAIIPVHLYGQPCNMDAIMAIAKKHNLKVIEDAAEAHGAEYKGKKVGSIGDIGCFSFYGNKVITTGEGGMCVTNSSKLANKMKILRDHGMSKTKKYWHDVVGYNYRLTNLQAAIGLAQLERIEEIQMKRSLLEKKYKDGLKSIKLLEFQKSDFPDRKKITWLVSALVKEGKRNLVMNQLKKINVDSRPFFYPLSSMKLYKPYVFSNKVSKNISKQGLNLPTSIFIDDQVISTIKKSLEELQ